MGKARKPALPPGKHEAAASADDLPAAHPEEYTPFAIDTPGSWLVLADIHVPYHDRETLTAAVTAAKKRGVKGVLLNGDLLDSHEISRHDKDPRAPRYIDEITTARQLLRWLRAQFPKARIVFKEGNHEERLPKYLFTNSPALSGLEGFDLPSLLKLADVGVEWVGDRRVIELGKLCVIHGHEYKGGGGVSPARWLFQRARYVSLCGHFHRTSSYVDRNIRNRFEAAWSVGCCCFLHPRYMPINSWNAGCAFVEVARDGSFSVDNLRMFNGRLV